MRVLVLADKKNWAYDSIAKALCKYNDRSNLHLQIMYTKGDIALIKKEYKKYDKIFLMGWQTYERVSFIDPKIICTGIHSHHSWDNKKTTPEKDVKPSAKTVDLMSKFLAINTVSKRLFSIFSEYFGVSYTPNGVDTQLFQYTKPPSEFTVGYSGSLEHDWRKGVSEFIIPSCQKSKVKLKVAMPDDKHYVKLDQMPSFYRDISVYLCASSSEGFSLSMLEAAASGKPIITTSVGGTNELISHGRNGFIVSRSVNDMSDHITYLKKNTTFLYVMGKNIRDDIEGKHSWKIASDAWFDFLEKN